MDIIHNSQSTRTGMGTSMEATAAPPHNGPNGSAASAPPVAVAAAPRATMISFSSSTSALTGTGTNIVTSPLGPPCSKPRPLVLVQVSAKNPQFVCVPLFSSFVAAVCNLFVPRFRLFVFLSCIVLVFQRITGLTSYTVCLQQTSAHCCYDINGTLPCCCAGCALEIKVSCQNGSSSFSTLAVSSLNTCMVPVPITVFRYRSKAGSFSVIPGFQACALPSPAIGENGKTNWF